MGRPPKGEAAMTGAERVRLWRERHGYAKRNETGNEKPCNETANETIATLQARNAELEAALKAATGNETKQNETGNETIATLQARVRELEEVLATPHMFVHRRLREEIVANKATKAEAKKAARAEVMAKVAAEVETLKAKLARFEAEPDAAYADRIKSLEAQLKAARTRIASLSVELRDANQSTALVLTKAELHTLRKALHPDTRHNEGALTKAAQLFNGLIDAKRIQFEGE